MNVSTPVTAYRLFSAALALVIPVSGLFLPATAEGLDPMWLRGLLSGWFVGLFGLSFHQTYRDWLPGLWTVSVGAASIWYLGVTVANGFALPYAVTVLLILPIGGSILQLSGDTLAAVRWYYGLGTLAVVGAVLTSDMPASVEEAYILAVLTLVLTMYVTQRAQRRAETELQASRETYKSLFDTAHDAVLVHDLEGHITDVNPRAEVLFGYDGEKLIGQELATLHAREGSAEVGSPIERLREGQEVDRRMRYVRADGSKFWGELSASIAEVRGDPVGFSMIRDVTSERKLRKRLQEERDLFSKVLETSPVAITIVDRDGSITFANSRAEDVLGLERSEVEDRTYNDSAWRITDVDGGEFPEEQLPFVRVMETGEPVFDVEHAIEWPDGTRRLISINGAPLEMEEGRPQRVVFALEDITQRRATKRALKESQERLQALFDHALDVILLADDEGRYVAVNPAATQVLGYPEEELLEMRVWDLTPETTQPEGQETWQAFLEAGHMEGEYELVTPAGETVQMEYRAVANIQPGLHLSVFRDVTDRKRLEKQADRFFSLSLDLLCIADTDGNFRRLNPAFHDVLGYEEEELLSRPFVEFIHPDDRPATRQALEQLSRGKEVQEFVNRYRRKNGGFRWIEWHATADPKGERVYAAARDVTSRREYEQHLKSAKEKAEKMNRLKSSFLANMSHEIRTPLTSIIGYAELLEEEIPEAKSRFLERIEQSGQRLLSTLNSVLDLAQLESGQINIRPETFDSIEEMQRLVESLEYQANQKNLDLRVDLPDRPLVVHTDKGIFIRILTNLLNNAIKFTKEGYVQLAGRVSNDRLLLEVEDTGIGMNEEFLEDLYKAFQQESMGLSRRYEGSGLGLAITKHLVDLLEGEIEVDSEQGRGTRFSVSLPLQALTTRPETTGDGRDRSGLSPLPDRLHVLIVDDDPAVAELLTEMLPQTYTFDQARRPDRALSLADPRTYDLVFLDINLKADITGEDVRRRMEERGALAEAKVIAITAYALPGDKQKLLGAGFDGYIAKPFDRQTLLARLTAIME